MQRPQNNKILHSRRTLLISRKTIRTSLSSIDRNLTIASRPDHLAWIVTPSVTLRRAVLRYIKRENRQIRRQIINYSRWNTTFDNLTSSQQRIVPNFAITRCLQCLLHEIESSSRFKKSTAL